MSQPTEMKDSGGWSGGNRIHMNIKRRLEDAQETMRQRTGSRPSLSEVIEMALDGEFARDRSEPTENELLAQKFLRWSQAKHHSLYQPIVDVTLKAIREFR